MKVLRGQNGIDLPEAVDTVRVGMWDADPQYHPNAVLWMLQQVLFEHFDANKLGIPERFFLLTASLGRKPTIYLIPVPDRDTEVEITDWPAAKKL